MTIERDLERVLRRRQPSEGFAARVVERLEREEHQELPAQRRGARGWRAVAAGLVLTAMAGGWGAQRAIERREGEKAAAEVLLAMKIASAKVRNAQQHVRDIGSR